MEGEKKLSCIVVDDGSQATRPSDVVMEVDQGQTNQQHSSTLKIFNFSAEKIKKEPRYKNRFPHSIPRVLKLNKNLKANFVNRLNIVEFSAFIDKKLTLLDEKSSQVLKYRTPHFRASAVIDVPPILDKSQYEIGWIQACTHMQFINTYGEDGVTSWEFPELVSGKQTMVSDADGRYYPWYGCKKELATVRGPQPQPQRVCVQMNDNFFPQVTWHIPYSAPGDAPAGPDRTPRLSRIHRNQAFTSYLALRDPATSRLSVLRAVCWTFELNVDVEPSRPLGQRATLAPPYEQNAPQLLHAAAGDKLSAGAPPLPPPPKCALRPPSANQCQALVWRPRVGAPRIVVAPERTTMNLRRYLDGTAHFGARLSGAAAAPHHASARQQQTITADDGSRRQQQQQTASGSSH